MAMAFHLACPITCRKICYCTLGFPGPLQSGEGRRAFLVEVGRLEALLRNPELVAAGGQETVEVPVPRIRGDFGNLRRRGNVGDEDDDRDERLSVQSKQIAMRKKATLASLAAEDYARKMEQGDFTGLYSGAEAALRLGRHKGTTLALEEATKRNNLQEDKESMVPKIVCRMCFSGEEEGTEKAERMLSCRSCSKKYHRSCLKRWAGNRDLFNWASWICPSCMSCEVCKRTGDPSKLMFCKRCDAACHSYCQQPAHKNVPPGPYLCPKHTWCHSCGSTVPGSGISTRWFVGYTSCDACGRLFIKGKYCPICLKVYRDSESTPMVCCDACQRWVHCVCDGISEEKYQEFQADGNLYYRCAACRGDCYQVKDLEDAVRELWRRRDNVEHDLMTTLRASAGLPSHEEMSHLCPSSDDDKEIPSAEREDGPTKKFKVIHKGVAEKAIKNGKDQVLKQKEYGRKASKGALTNKKHVKKIGQLTQSNDKMVTVKNNSNRFESDIKVEEDTTTIKDLNGLGYEEMDDEVSQKSDGIRMYSHLITMNSVRSGLSVEYTDNKMLKDNPVESDISSGKKNSKEHKSKNSFLLSHTESHDEPKTEIERYNSKGKSSKGTKIVIHLPPRDRGHKQTGKSYHRAPSEVSSCHREDGSAGSQGFFPNHSWGAHLDSKMQEPLKNMDVDVNGRKSKKPDKHQKNSSKERGNSMPLRIGKPLPADEYESDDLRQEAEANVPNSALSVNSRVQRSKDGYFEDFHANMSQDEDSFGLTRKRFKGTNLGGQTGNQGTEVSGVDDSLLKRPLKVKFKKPWRDEDEVSLTKGQRSKRKRPHTLEIERQEKDEKESTFNPSEDTVDKFLDDNWILMKLGKDAIGKRVEVYLPFDNTWNEGSVTGMGDKQSALIVHLDDGRDETIELGKQSVRLISHSKKRPRT